MVSNEIEKLAGLETEKKGFFNWLSKQSAIVRLAIYGLACGVAYFIGHGIRIIILGGLK